MFVYGDWGKANSLEGLHKISSEPRNTDWATITKIEENKNFSERLIEHDDLHLVMWQKNFLHAFCNMVQYILHFHRINKNAHFLIMFGSDFRDGDQEINHAKFILQMLKDKNISHEFVSLREENVVVGKSTYMKIIPFSSFVFKEVYEYCGTKINRVERPKKIAYLARSKVKPKSDFSIFNNRDPDLLKIKNDLRVEDEEILIEYFQNKGYEIVYPEDFNSFEEQIKFFDDVKTMICSSGSGMANMMFMQPGNIVIELQTPVLIAGTQQVHPFYEGFAWAKRHNFITIPNERKSAEIIEHFENKRLFDYL